VLQAKKARRRSSEAQLHNRGITPISRKKKLNTPEKGKKGSGRKVQEGLTGEGKRNLGKTCNGVRDGEKDNDRERFSNSWKKKGGGTSEKNKSDGDGGSCLSTTSRKKGSDLFQRIDRRRKRKKGGREGKRKGVSEKMEKEKSFGSGICCVQGS